MGDRWYTQQKQSKSSKTPRRLKKDIIADLENLVGEKLPGIERTTIATIEKLILLIEKKLQQ
jgi:hypothetical protein